MKKGDLEDWVTKGYVVYEKDEKGRHHSSL